MDFFSKSAFISTFAMILSSQVHCQVYVFQSIEEHSQRISNIESTVSNMTTCCQSIRLENQWLREANANLTKMLENLAVEVERLKQLRYISATTSVTSSTTHEPKQTTTQRQQTISTMGTTSQHPSTTSAAPVGKDCADLYKKNIRKNGVYNIRISQAKPPIAVYCDMESDGGGWTVIQRRQDGSVDFDQDWGMYRGGFGNVTGEFWLGNELIHALSNGGNTFLRVDAEDWTRVAGYAEYQGFHVASEQADYALTVGSYKGNIGDSFNYPQSYLLRHNHMSFSTKDRDNDKNFNNCARVLKGGWWFNSCYSSNLNGHFLRNGPFGTRTMGEIAGEPTLEGTGVEWYPWKQKQYSLIKSVMKIRPETFP